MSAYSWCTEKGAMCEKASPNGHCMMTACTKPITSGAIATNADHIRAMSDEELTEFISRVEIGDFSTSDYGKTFCDLCDFDSCDECLLAWLQQPPKEGKT